MKYFKFTQISEETGISWAIAQPLSGPSYPFSLLPGLSNIISLDHDPMFNIGEANDEAQANTDNYIFEITAQERAQEIQKLIDFKIQEKLSKIYQEEKEFRQTIFSKYDESASIAGVYKYEEAKQLINDSEALAPQIRQEASIRNVNPVVLAQRIISNHEDFRNKEAKIAGIRGYIQDRLNNFTFDLQNPDASMTDFNSMEKIGEEIIDGVTTDVLVGKYDLNIGTRFHYLD